ncbi:ABC transporter substrate-binding protein [Georgenia yuyongxinii]|uniref:Amino acid ABC transporter substrate-binding protein n=1 Tax=Georgenia yuyongxinii TaxID=2589797 RepID=A0A552WUZ0_9MICO|nr:ABC transporter substrate-binding protein [Georgenia yuyongxinii]TRW46594.1 amino acid ABC transporter substrate-binding protein [Georgenia yuyongxinii]
MVSKRVMLMGATAAAGLFLAGCVTQQGAGGTADTGAEPTTAGSADPLVIGIVQAASGFMGPIDTPAREALMIEVERLNESGGIGGRLLEVEFVDTETNFERYAPAAEEVIAKGAEVLIVTCDYDVSSPASLVAEAKNVLHIAPCAGDPFYGPAGGFEIGFSMGFGAPAEPHIMAEFSMDRGWTNAVLLRDTTLKYSQNQCDDFAERFTELGGTVIAEHNYQQGESVREAVSKIAAGAMPDVIANCGYSPGGAQVAKELRDGGVESPIVSGFGMDGDFWAGSMPDLTDYYVVTYAAKNGDDPDTEINDYAAEYEARYGKRPDVGGFVTGPSALQAVAAAYAKAQSWDGDKLAAAMESFADEPLLAGPTTFTDDVHISQERPGRVLMISDGKLVFVEERAPQSASGA